MGAKYGQFKLVLLGESSVGKSSVVYRFIKEQFEEFRESTIGAAFLTQSVKVNNEKGEEVTIKFEIWDTAGQERYKSLAPMYYRNAHCAIVVYDITRESSLAKAKNWVSELRKQNSNNANKNMVIALVGNKSDLESERKVDKLQAFEYTREEGLLFFEVSAKTGEGVRDVFDHIAKSLAESYEESMNSNNGMNMNPNQVDLMKGTQNNDTCAC
ncbi:Rab family GTPase [Saccharomycopsis crataegensis]|uniref:Rab family GTPase n=1 Tax=Saccharomycopsis crataegensis TaxID=43959 RepID=A0AAV5QF56_9ASCO|nr:Rab family GTPase [Saccharomycopsis crataegensis]